MKNPWPLVWPSEIVRGDALSDAPFSYIKQARWAVAGEVLSWFCDNTKNGCFDFCPKQMVKLFFLRIIALRKRGGDSLSLYFTLEVRFSKFTKTTNLQFQWRWFRRFFRGFTWHFWDSISCLEKAHLSYLQGEPVKIADALAKPFLLRNGGFGSCLTSPQNGFVEWWFARCVFDVSWGGTTVWTSISSKRWSYHDSFRGAM